jgi:glyoxylase-like metal-dependent hydrolase (beta-lactamase superfamily II)
MKLYAINAGYFKLDGGAMFGVVPKSIWNKLCPADENNMCNWAMRCLLIEDAGKLILIDNGMGDKQSDKFFAHYYMHGSDTLEKSLATHGFTKDDITDVVLTHLHFDHCGGSIIKQEDDFVPAFKNATYWSNAKHWQWATQPNEREKASFLTENISPIQESGRLQLINLPVTANIVNDTNHFTPVASGISNKLSFIVANGHTDAMMLPVIKYKEQTLVFMADLLPSTAHLPLPYVMGYDMFPLITLQEKKAFLQEAVQNNYVLFFEHDPINECCTLQQTEKGVRVEQIITLRDL